MNNLFQPLFNARMQHALPVLRTPHDVVVALIDHVPVDLVAMRFS